MQVDVKHINESLLITVFLNFIDYILVFRIISTKKEDLWSLPQHLSYYIVGDHQPFVVSLNNRIFF